MAESTSNTSPLAESVSAPQNTTDWEFYVPPEADTQSGLRDRIASGLASVIDKSHRDEVSKHLGPRQSVAQQAQLERTKRDLLHEAVETHDSNADAGRAFAHTMRARIMPRRTAKQQIQKGRLETATVQANQAVRRAQDKERTEAVAKSLGLPQERTSRYRAKVVDPRLTYVKDYIYTQIKPPLAYRVGDALGLTEAPFEERLDEVFNQHRNRIYTPETQQPITSSALEEAKARGDRDAYRKELRRLAEGAGFINRRGIYQEKYGRDLDAEDAAEAARLAEIEAQFRERKQGNKNSRNQRAELKNDETADKHQRQHKSEPMPQEQITEEVIKDAWDIWELALRYVAGHNRTDDPGVPFDRMSKESLSGLFKRRMGLDEEQADEVGGLLFKDLQEIGIVAKEYVNGEGYSVDPVTLQKELEKHKPSTDPTQDS
jgi:hypothetical protein